MTDNYDGYINTDVVERLGIEVIELPEGTVSDNQRRYLNTSVLAETALLIVPCVDQRHAGETAHAWVLLWQYPECLPFWEWKDRNYGGFSQHLDLIIASAKHFKLPLFVPVDTVTFRNDDADS